MFLDTGVPFSLEPTDTQYLPQEHMLLIGTAQDRAVRINFRTVDDLRALRDKIDEYLTRQGAP